MTEYTALRKAWGGCTGLGDGVAGRDGDGPGAEVCCDRVLPRAGRIVGAGEPLHGKGVGGYVGGRRRAASLRRRAPNTWVWVEAVQQAGWLCNYCTASRARRQQRACGKGVRCAVTAHPTFLKKAARAVF